MKYIKKLKTINDFYLYFINNQTHENRITKNQN
jgi:hypothetical protein